MPQRGRRERPWEQQQETGEAGAVGSQTSVLDPEEEVGGWREKEEEALRGWKWF